MVSAAAVDVLLMLVSQVLNLESDISAGGEVQAAAKALTKEMGALLANKKAILCGSSPELEATESRPGPILYS